MKIVGVEVLQNCGRYASSKEWRTTRAMLHDAVKRVSWPPGAKRFTIYPESGKKTGEGNGVKPIKNELMQELEEKGWKLEEPLGVAILKRPGKLDAVLYTSYGPVALEWETGNISSSHRALNKMALGLLKGVLACGILDCAVAQLLQIPDGPGGQHRRVGALPGTMAIHTLQRGST